MSRILSRNGRNDPALAALSRSTPALPMYGRELLRLATGGPARWCSRSLRRLRRLRGGDVHAWPLALGAFLALEGSIPTTSRREAVRSTGPNVLLGGTFQTETARRAVRRAARLLERPACRGLLAEFAD